MENKKKSKQLNFEEDQVNGLAFIYGAVALIEAFFVVVIVLNGPKRDCFMLVMPVIAVLIKLLRRKTNWMKKYEKYLCMTLIPLWCSMIVIVDGEGLFAALTQFYFMWLILSVGYYDVKMVLLCSGSTIVCTVVSFLLFPEALLKIDNPIIWIYIMSLYILATALAFAIAGRTRRLMEQLQKMRHYEDELIYLEQLEKKEEKHSEFIHNMNHYFVAIGELARQENCQQIVGLMEELNVDIMQNERIIYTHQKIVNAILSQKMSEAVESDIDFDIYVEPGIRLGDVSSNDWVVILGNLLDNAFEAARECQGEKRKITLRIFMEKDGGVCVLRLKNYFVTKPRRHQSGFLTSKKEKALHGIGIKSVENTIEKYNGWLQCTVEEETFLAVLVLPMNHLQAIL